MVKVSDVRSELQLPVAIVSDNDIKYALGKVGDDLNLACAEVLRMVVRKYRGRIRYTIGRYTETIQVDELRRQIREYMYRSTNTQFESVDADVESIFTREDI